jgi:hypothetical protein
MHLLEKVSLVHALELHSRIFLPRLVLGSEMGVQGLLLGGEMGL